MKKTTLITLFCVCLMLVTPFSVIARENTISSNLKEQPDIERIVAQIRVVIDEILQKYGNIPMVKSIFTWILGYLIWIFSMLIWIFSYIKYFLIIIYCVSFFIVLMLLVELANVVYNSGFSRLEDLILYFGLFLTFLYIGTGCGWFPPYNPLKSFYTLLKTNDITNLAKDCPCLQD